MTSIRMLTVLAAVLLAASGCGMLGLRPHPKRDEPAASVGRLDQAAWTATTWESVATPQNRAVLQRARPESVVGEVVDVSCFLQLGKRGEAHIPCGQKCVKHGQPIGVLTDEGELYLVMPEEHHPRRDGDVSIRERFAELMGKRVQVSGMRTEYEDSRALFVRTLPDPS